MNTAMSPTLPAPTIAPDAAAVPSIVPPVDPGVLYFTGVVVNGSIVLTYQTQAGLDIDLTYSSRWSHTPTSLVIQLPLGWDVVPSDENITWVGSDPIWVGQIGLATIKAIVSGAKKVVKSSFTLYESSTSKRIDPAVIIRGEV
jgi:hypothetical protein